MTKIRAGVVDVFVIRAVGKRWRMLTLRRARGTRCTGSWETVHGRIERGEKPAEAALRELREETGLLAARAYTITVNPFYLSQQDTVELAVVFAAFVRNANVRLSDEHDAFEWLTPARAAKRLIWPRDVEALDHIRRLLRGGDAGPVEDVLRIL